MSGTSKLIALAVSAWVVSACASTNEGDSGQPVGMVGAPGAQVPTGQTPTPTTMTPGGTTTPPVTSGNPSTAGSGAPPVTMPPATMTPPSTTEPPPAPMGTSLSTTPITYDDPNLECYEFRAHPSGNPSQPLMVGVANDRYLDVVFDAPWTGTVYGKSFRTLIDNDQAIHHWLFYQGTGAGRSLVHGWAPGGTDMYFSPDSGMQLPDSGYSIQYHYNSSDPSAADASGLEVCVTTTAPEKIATISWLGTDAINGTTATGTCRPRTPQRIHILGATPHMHLKGINMKVVVNRAAGGQEVVHDMPFDFQYQRQYPHDLWIEPGDSITTTCTYNAPSSFGPGTTDEMCYWFPIHYPANGLVDGGFIGSAIHGPNTCLGM